MEESSSEFTFELTPGVSLVFCSLQSARSILSDADDPFFENLQEFELSARRGAPVSLEEFLEYQASQARAWPSISAFEPTLIEIGKMLARFPIFVENLPNIRMVLSTGCEEAREPRKVAYCRGDDAIVISEANLKVGFIQQEKERMFLTFLLFCLI